MATFSKNRVFGKLINQYEINGVSYSADTIGSITVGESGPATIAAGAGTTVYATTAQLPVSGNNEGDQAFVSGNNRLYIWNGSGWYNIALINTNPSISSIADSDGVAGPFFLSTEGIATTITIIATDPEGLPITYTAETDSAFNGIATIAQDSSVFTITPFSLDSAVGSSGSITFRASDGVNIASSVQSFTLSFLSAYWNETVLSIGTNSTNGLANSTFIDRSTNTHTITTAGTPTQTAFHPYLENWSVEFDGTDDRLETSGASPDFAYGTSDFTIECWAYSTEGNRYANIVQQRGTGGPLLRIENNNKLQYFRGDGVNAQIGTTTILTNQWYHFALSRNNNTIKIYINGVEELSFSETYNFSTYGYVQVASFNNVEYFKGYISNIRIVKGTALYTSNFTPPTEKLTAVSGTSLLTCQSNRFIDNSSNAHTITVSGNPAISASNPFGQESEYAVGENKGSVYNSSGISNYVTLGSNTFRTLGNTDWTWETWIYPLDSTNMKFMSSRSGGSGYEFFTYFNSKFAFEGYGSSNTSGQKSSINTFPAGQWHHIAIVNTTSDTKLYVNGNLEVTFSNSFTWDSSVDNRLFGAYDFPEDASGYVSDMKFTYSEVYTSNFTPPTSPVGNTNASLYLPMDNAGIFDKTGNNTLTLFGNTATSTAQTKYADTAIAFDGSGDFIEIPYAQFNPNSELFQTDTYTLETWALQTAAQTGSGGAIFDTRFNSVNGAQLRVNTNGTLIYYYTQGAQIVTSVTVSNNVWYHIAVVNNAGTCTLYLDGSSVGTVSMGTALSSTAPLRIGGDNNTANYTGYLENFQIFKGVAKYTANFTPPAGPQGRTYQAES
jgi:hypothetical protein